MVKPDARSATIEEIIKDITNEDLDTALLVHYNRHGKFVVMNMDGSSAAWGDTLKSALIKFFTSHLEMAVYHAYVTLEDISEFQSLDWQSAYNDRFA